MKLGIFSNFGPLSGHVGGSEAVVAAISKGLIEAPYNCEVSIYAYNYKQQSICEGVNLIPCERDGSTIVSQVNDNEHSLIYSDSMWNFDLILNNIDKVSQKLSLCLVGAYFLQSHPQMADILKESIDKFNLITHSSTTPDYKWCADNNLPVTVIPNGVDLGEFENNIDFRKKYKIKEKYILLSVGNFFYGKGQEILSSIDVNLRQSRDDFKIVQISVSIDYKYDRTFLGRAKHIIPNNVLFLRNIPREDVVAAFKCSDIFLQTSLKEVAPLVILESRAAKLPWVSMDVGNVKSMSGGIIINNLAHDEKGYKVVNGDIIDQFASQIKYIMEGVSPVTGQSFHKVFVDSGQMNISKIDWKNIVPMYHKVFSEGKS